jgi:hypothetical protein
MEGKAEGLFNDMVVHSQDLEVEGLSFLSAVERGKLSCLVFVQH